MPYDEGLAQRIRDLITDHPNTTEKKMFGGIAFMVNGNMALGITGKNELMVRIGPDQYEKALKERYAKEMDFTGRPMKGMIFIESEGVESDEILTKWIEKGMTFASSLPAK